MNENQCGWAQNQQNATVKTQQNTTLCKDIARFLLAVFSKASI